MKLEFRVETFTTEHWLRHWQWQVQQNRHEVSRELAEETVGRIIESTPVETGRARGGWVGAAEQLNLPAPAGWGGNDAEAMNEGVSSGSGSLEESSDSTRYTLRNDVLYVPILEYGSSKMAARAIVRRTLPGLTTFIRNLLPRWLR